MVSLSELKVGDLVLLTDDIAVINGFWDLDSNSNENTNMSCYLGAIVTIRTIGSGMFSVEESNPAGDNEWAFKAKEIVRIATLEEKEAYLLKKEAARLAKEEEQAKLYKSMVINTTGVREIAEDALGKEFVMVENLGTNGLSVTMHFPEVEITNSRDEHHLIRDLFVRLIATEISPKSTFKCNIIGITGARTTYTKREVASGYSHSHLHSGIHFPGGTDYFCIGSGDLSAMIQRVRMSMDKDSWYLLFLTIQKFVAWESIEGGPYFGMQYIDSGNLGSGRNIDQSILNTEAERLLPNLPISSWDYTGDSFTLNRSNRELRDYFNKNSVYKSMIIAGSGSLLPSDIESRTYKFNGKEFKFTIVDEGIKGEREEPENFIEETLIENYCTKINNDITQFNKNYKYELLKSSQQVFTEAGAF
jgi:hypothetical protein